MTVRIFLSALYAAALTGCAVNLPSAPADNPAEAHAPEAATRPLQPMLVANSRTLLSPTAGDREEKAKKMDMSKMKQGGTQHGSMEGKQGMSQEPKTIATPTPLPGNAGSVPAGSYYTCLMHPQIKKAKPGQCPICGMTLVKKSGE
ncbi:MAG: hypothetical protein H0X34_05045 [Chthoniobacterales bacterium]|nr:hypothetical protein [Chthoniobacterales bacterium]